MDLIADLNLPGVIDRQDGKCLKCRKELNLDRVYFRMDQAIHLYEVYCEKCGIEWEKKDKKSRKSD